MGENALTKVEKATRNLRLTGWKASQAAQELGVSPRIARMYLSGKRKIPYRLWDKIPVYEYTGDTHAQSRMRKEQRIAELKCYALEVPKIYKKSLFSQFRIIFERMINYCVPRWQQQ